MYYEYFGLKQPPFNITPDTSLFYPGGNRGAVLEALIYAITEGEGIVKVVGEVGTGKTMLCRMLEVELPENVEVVYLANPRLSPEDILYAIAFELKLDVTETDNRLKLMNELQNYLLDRHADNRQIVVFVEEAQAMPIATLEEIRLLSNLETTQDKLLQIVLFGQPELDEKIATREIRQLKERITYSFQLAPFKKDEVKDYLNSRMRTCGYRSGDVFTPSAVSNISKYSKGLIRRINILADKALLAAYAGNTHKVTSSHVKFAAQDSEFIINRILPMPALVSVVVLVFVVILGGIAFPEKINQGIYTIQKSFGTNAEPRDTQIHPDSTLIPTEKKALTALTSEYAVHLKLTQNLSNSAQINKDILAIDESVTANNIQDEQIETIYLPGDGEVMSVSTEAEIEKTRKKEEEKIEISKKNAESRMQEEKEKLEEIYSKNTDEMKKLQEMKARAEAQIKKAKEQIEKQANESRRELAEAKNLKSSVEEDRKKLERDAEEQREEQAALEKSVKEKAKALLEQERRKLADKVLEQAQKEKAVAEAGRVAAKEEADKMIEEYKAKFEKEKAELQAQLKAERSKLEEEAQQIGKKLDEVHKARDDAEAASKLAEKEASKLKVKQAKKIEKEVISVSTEAEVDSQSLGLNMSDKDISELARLNRDNEIGSLSESKKLIEDGGSAKTNELSENEDVLLLPSKPVAIGMTEQEFERFKQQLVKLPPEVKLEDTSGVVCEKCASIIYRPIL
jgi:type II secretory pathway predicted ATPase ExeA